VRIEEEYKKRRDGKGWEEEAVGMEER